VNRTVFASLHHEDRVSMAKKTKQARNARTSHFMADDKWVEQLDALRARYGCAARSQAVVHAMEELAGVARKEHEQRDAG
jgi:hypothetical protein